MKMFPHDFFGSPAEKSFRALIPNADMAIQIAGDNRVIGDIQQSRFFRQLPFNFLTGENFLFKLRGLFFRRFRHFMLANAHQDERFIHRHRALVDYR